MWIRIWIRNTASKQVYLFLKRKRKNSKLTKLRDRKKSAISGHIKYAVSRQESDRSVTKTLVKTGHKSFKSLESLNIKISIGGFRRSDTFVGKILLFIAGPGQYGTRYKPHVKYQVIQRSTALYSVERTRHSRVPVPHRKDTNTS